MLSAKISKNKNAKSLSLAGRKIFFIFLFSMKALLLYQQGTGFITINDRHMIDQQGNPFFVKGINYHIDLFVPSGTGSANMEMRPSIGNYAGFIYPCNNQNTCFTSITNDFKFIRDSLGCNTIRLSVGSAGIDSCGSPDFSVYVTDGAGGSHTYHTTDLTFLVPFYSRIADTAAVYGMKIILLPSVLGLTCIGNPTLQNYVYAFVRTMAIALKNKSAIMAYDEFNEPQFYGGDNPNFTKEEIWNMTHSWYDTLKINDPNHLITVGLSVLGLTVDAFQWSTDVYKADFYAFHIYANRSVLTHQACCDGSGNPYTVMDQNLDQCSTQVYIERFNAAITWIQNTTNLPWLLGETGFEAPHGFTCGNTTNLVSDGDEQGQKDFILNALTQTIKAGGMGTVWWDYKESYWFPPNDPALIYYGLVDHNGIAKPAGNAMRNFISNNVTGAPTGYPANYKNIMNSTGTPVNGTVTDQNSQLVKDAGVYGVHYDINLNTYTYGVTTITDASGNFTMTSATPSSVSGPPDPTTTEVTEIFVSAIGCDIKNTYRSTAALVSGQTYILNKATNYDKLPSPAQYMATNNDPIVSTPNILTLTNFGVNYSGSGTVYRHDFIAMNEIEILPQSSTDSYVVLGAEAAFYIAPVDVVCNDFAWSNSTWQRKAHAGNGKNAINSSAVENGTQLLIETKTVYLSPESFLLNLYPNPANDKILVESEKSINFITLSNMYGASVAEFNLSGAKEQHIDVSAMAPGTYMIKITYSDNSITYSQIIKQ